MDKHTVRSDSQYGFRKKRSTDVHFLKQREALINGFEKLSLALGIFINLTKALDHMEHTFIISKIRNYGIPRKASYLINSLLEHRKLFVLDNLSSSTLNRIRTGALRGSILRPHLRILNVNEIFSVINNTEFLFK